MLCGVFCFNVFFLCFGTTFLNHMLTIFIRFAFLVPHINCHFDVSHAIVSLQGKQGKMKEMYEQAVKESEQPAARRGAEVRSEKAKSIKEKFERGETLVSDGEDGEEGEKKIKDEDLGVFEAGMSILCLFMFEKRIQ